MLINDIFEYEGALWTEGSILWISINIGYSQGKRVNVVNGSFRPCIGVLLGGGILSVWLLYRFFY